MKREQALYKLFRIIINYRSQNNSSGKLLMKFRFICKRYDLVDEVPGQTSKKINDKG
jgi:hypothetical protein